MTWKPHKKTLNLQDELVQKTKLSSPQITAWLKQLEQQDLLETRSFADLGLVMAARG